MKNPDNQPALRSGSAPIGGEQPEACIVTQPQDPEEAEELIFSMTTHAMRDPDYSREKNGIMKMTITHAREYQNEIDESQRAIHQRLGPIEARMKQRMERKE